MILARPFRPWSWRVTHGNGLMIMSQCPPPKASRVLGTTLVRGTATEDDGVLPLPTRATVFRRVVRLRCRYHDWVKRSGTHLTGRLEQVYGAV